MKRFFLTFLLMMTAAVCAAEMNYDLPSTHLTYTQLEADAVPMLIDEPSPQAILGGADGETEIVIALKNERVKQRAKEPSVHEKPSLCRMDA